MLFGLFFLLFLEDALHSGEINLFLLILGPLLFTASLIQLLKALSYKFTTKIIITAKKIVFQTGLIVRETLEFSLEQVEGVTITQTLLGRFFGYGDVVIVGTGTTVKTIYSVANVARFESLF